MTTRIRELVQHRSIRTLLLLIVMAAAVTTMTACNGYASVNVGAATTLECLSGDPRGSLDSRHSRSLGMTTAGRFVAQPSRLQFGRHPASKLG